MWEQEKWVGPNQHLVEPPNVPILLFFKVIVIFLQGQIHYPKFPMAIKAPPSAQELFAHRHPQ